MTQVLMTIDEYCKHKKINRRMFYRLKDKGTLPDPILKSPVGKKYFILVSI